jgi:hypothetical protein
MVIGVRLRGISSETVAGSVNILRLPLEQGILPSTLGSSLFIQSTRIVLMAQRIKKRYHFLKICRSLVNTFQDQKSVAAYASQSRRKPQDNNIFIFPTK